MTAFSCTKDTLEGGDVPSSTEIKISVTPDGWKPVSSNAAEGNAVYTRSGIDENSYSLTTIVQASSEAGDVTKAGVLDNGGLQSKGFNVTAVVKENSTGNLSLLMNDEDISYSGASWTYSPTKYWPSINQYTTAFYAYRKEDFSSRHTESDGVTPYLSYTVPVEPAQQKDLVAARYTDNDASTVEFPFSHLLTAIKIKAKNIARPILKIELTGVYDTGTYHLSDMSWRDVGFSSSNPTGEFTYNFVGSQSVGKPETGTETYVKDDNGSEFYLMMLPQDLGAAGRSARIKFLFDNGTVLESELDTNWEAGKTVTYVVSYDSITCQWLEDSNSYIISPIEDNNRNLNLFAIPISFRINTFWQNEGGRVKPITGGTEYVAEVIWQDSPNRVINFTDASGTSSSGAFAATVPAGGGDNEYVFFKLENIDFTETSNVIVGVRKAGESTYLWSWHLWITPYYPIPDNPVALNSAARIPVQNGSIERYDDSDLPDAASNWDKLPNRYLMDRNIGAKGSCNDVEINMENYKKTFGMYYQFGRKDPFPPNGMLYRMKEDGSIETLGELTNENASLIVPTSKNIPFNGTEAWPVVKTVQYPMEFVVSNTINQHVEDSGNWRNPSWYPAGNTPGSKSFYDPCPPGWRIPYGTVFNIFGKRYNSNKTFQVKIDEDKLKIDGKVVGYKYYIDKNQSLSTNYYIWVNRDYAQGLLWDISVNDVGNSLIWRSESFKIFQLFIQYAGLFGHTEMDNTCNMECYGAQVRAIHE